MPATSKATEFLTGKIYWAKILGDPRMNYNGDGKEWTLEFEPNEDGLKVFKAHKLTDRIKTDKEDRAPYVKLRKKADPADPRPIRVYSADNTEWPSDKLIGNGSVVDVKLSIRGYGPGKKTGVYVEAVRVRDLVPYVSTEFGKMDGDVAPAKPSAFEEDFELA